MICEDLLADILMRVYMDNAHVSTKEQWQRVARAALIFAAPATSEERKKGKA